MHRLSDALVQVPTSQCRFVRESECLEQPRRRLVAIHDPGLQPRQAEVSDRPVNHVLYRQSAMTVPPVSWMPDTDADLSSPVTPVDGVDRTLPYQFSVRRSQHEVVFGPWLRARGGGDLAAEFSWAARAPVRRPELGKFLPVHACRDDLRDVFVGKGADPYRHTKPNNRE